MDKTFVYEPNSNGGGNGWGNDMWNNPIWAIVFLAALNNGGFGFGGGNGRNANTDFVASQLGSAIQGNANAISNLATHLDCSIGQVQSGLLALQQAIQSGTSGLSAQMAQCCCDTRNAITTQGFENRIATAEQTSFLGAKIDYQTTFLADKFCELEKREMQNKIDALREAKSTLEAQLSNEHQTLALQNYTAQSLAPISAALSGLQSEVDGIKCKLPQTVNVPYSPVTAIPNCVAYNWGLYGGFPFGGSGNQFI